MTHRPLTIRIVMWGALILALANIWRAVALADQRELLQALGASLDPTIRLILAILWALLFLATAIAIWQRRAWTRYLAPALLLLYALYRLALVLCCVSTEVARAGWPAWVAVYILAILFTIRSLNRPAAITYFAHQSSLDSSI